MRVGVATCIEHMQHSDKPLLYDVFCGAGGCTKGYQMAGFYVIGIDEKPQPRYCGDEFIQMDALQFLRDYIAGKYREAAAIHTSPPCQEYAKTKKINKGNHPDLVAPVRELLKATGKPYVIENVPGSPLIDPVALNGVMFGLRVNRPRLFECHPPIDFFLLPPPMPQAKMGRPARFDGDFVQPVGNFSGVDYVRDAMNIPWMTRDELSQAIPPAYTRWLGEQMLRAIQ